MKCELCDEHGDERLLMGVTHAELCPKHRRAFSDTARRWPAFDAYCIERVRLNATIHKGDEDRASVLAVRLIELEHEMRKLTLEWLAEHKEGVTDAAKTDPAQPG